LKPDGSGCCSRTGGSLQRSLVRRTDPGSGDGETAPMPGHACNPYIQETGEKRGSQGRSPVSGRGVAERVLVVSEVVRHPRFRPVFLHRQPDPMLPRTGIPTRWAARAGRPRTKGSSSKAASGQISSDTLSRRTSPRAGSWAEAGPMSIVSSGRPGRSSSLRTTRRAMVCALAANNRTHDQPVDWGK
jgi:hypothetical protein